MQTCTATEFPSRPFQSDKPVHKAALVPLHWSLILLPVWSAWEDIQEEAWTALGPSQSKLAIIMTRGEEDVSEDAQSSRSWLLKGMNQGESSLEEELCLYSLTSCILKRTAGLGLDTALFLNDFKFLKLCGLSNFLTRAFLDMELF